MTKRKRKRPVDRTFARAFALYEPPTDLKVSEWASKNRILSRENSAEAGLWRNERTPYLVEVMDSFNDPKVSRTSLVSGSQIGKTEVENNILGYIVDQDPGGILFIQPTVDDCKKYSKTRLDNMIRDTKVLKKKIKDIKSRDSTNTVLTKSFPGGNLILVGSNAASGLASNPMRYIIGDEIDRWALDAGNEGDPYELAVRRTTTFYNHKIITVSTPTIKGVSKIEKIYNSGTQEHWCKKCPNCGEYHDIVFNDIKFEFETLKNGRKTDYKVTKVEWLCPSCGCYATEAEMRKQPAEWIADNPQAYERGHRSFWLNAFVSPWQRWEKIVYEFLKARKDPKALQVVYNTLLGELWEDRGDLEDEETYLEKREDYGIREDGSPVELPDGVLCLTCGVDTQDDRLEYEIVGHGHYGETWGIKKGVIMGDPHYGEPWERLDDVIDKVYRFKNRERGLKISITFVDSGGHKTQDVYRETARRFHRQVFAIKGQGGDGIPYTKPPTKVNIVVNGRIMGKAWLYTLGVDAGKADIMSNLKVEEAGAKYCHFPKGAEYGYDYTYFSGLLSEKLVLKNSNGRTRWVWEKLPGHERNEALDCRNYALAAFRALDPDLDAVERRLRGLAPMQTEKKPKRIKVKRSASLAEGW